MSSPSSDARFEQAKVAFLDGLKCQQDGDLAQAEGHYRRSLEWLPGRASTLINLAAMQLARGRPQDALASADGALAAEPDSADAMLHRATALAQLGRLPDALTAFDRLLALAPEWAPAWSLRGSVLRELHRFDEAAHSFRQALKHGADPEMNGYYLAGVQGGTAPLASPPGYVQELFDRYAEEFDDHLVEQLRYQGHRRLVDGLSSLHAESFESAADLGCGTGLCGALMRPIARRLTGVDLSARMLDKARARGVYDELEHAEVVSYLQATPRRHDLLLAADVLIYIGDLHPLFAAAACVMSRGVFALSVEALPDDSAGFRLRPSLRFAHSPAYIRQLAAQHGFEIAAIQDAPVREDQREAVSGLFVHLRRTLAA